MGTVKKQINRHSYIVECDGVCYQRNRRFIPRTTERKEDYSSDVDPFEELVELDMEGKSRNSDTDIEQRVTESQVRRSQRMNKGVPPAQYGVST